MKIAVASTNGLDVNEHFGRVREFLVYQMDSGELHFVARRSVAPLSTGDRSHEFSEEKFQVIYERIKDCRRLYTVAIGDRPREELAARSIETVLYEGPIANIS